MSSPSHRSGAVPRAARHSNFATPRYRGGNKPTYSVGTDTTNTATCRVATCPYPAGDGRTKACMQTGRQADRQTGRQADSKRPRRSQHEDGADMERWAGLAPASPHRKWGAFPWTTNAGHSARHLAARSRSTIPRPRPTRKPAEREPNAKGRPRRYDATGSQLFEEIRRLPACCPPRSEERLLRDHADEVVRLSGATELVDLGAGSAEKSELLLSAMAAHGLLRAYTGIDVSPGPMKAAGRRFATRRPAVRVTTVHGDFSTALPWLRGRGTGRLVAMLGNTFGCLTPPERSRFLRSLRDCCGPHDHVLLCVDLYQPVEAVRRAYGAGFDGERPVRRLFALNTLAHLNNEYGADFELASYEPTVVYDVPLKQVRGEMTRRSSTT
ncbi:L-histidine N(alpha)-methyltransferase [Streptomyces sp. CA-132043]|uniref:L-histidine N(alpha)-methyltransferase n=1 Tax=Streptomyces sp. CA-132043 TaxID=3240048 RepID=UPI003D90A226